MSLRVRPPRPDEAAVVAALGNAYDRALGGDGGRSDADVARRLGRPRRRAQGRVAGRARRRLGRPCVSADDGHGRLFALGWVGPDHAGQGVGTQRSSRSPRGGRASSPAPPTRPGSCSAMPSCDADLAARELLESRAYRRTERPPADGRRPGRGASGAGLAGRGCAAAFDPGTDGPAVDAVRRGGVLERVDATRRSGGGQKVADARFDRRLWIVARDGDDVCGVALCTPETFGMGFVESLAVGRARGGGAAGRGASARRGFARLWGPGERQRRPGRRRRQPGARRLYERARHADRMVAGRTRRRCAPEAVKRGGNRGPKPAAGVRPA